MTFKNRMETKYRKILMNYLDNQSEQVLYQGQKFSRKLIEHQITPEEMISLHRSILLEIEPDLKESILHSFDVLLEIMMGYGLAYREHQSLRDQQIELKNEMEVAANMQRTLLGTKIPSKEHLDIGAISVPAKKMNGDYFHFIEDEENRLGVAIADIIGKGIPAALCMSMIKYAMDSLTDIHHQPSQLLEDLNRVVEQNVDPSMFITMFYGMYDPNEHQFHYASAGHEPGFFYDADLNKFLDLEAKGLLLGVNKKTKYQGYSKKLNIGDMIILLSDGVTECRTDEGFIEREAIISYIRKNIHLSAKDIVNNVYKDLERLQAFQLRDDFTLIIIKRVK
ncbi:PP2C family protein-serine/threonine phosphatase [Bacillus sp. FJAT-49736]|uniref:PP2C family protein-serine/threonine phosphatase n=1 Tax=Bacillus sp. FJAT-49736 TaxID=2833582 RepID=UPI001BC90C9B|nr:PP2C family protein-serine/threonine phosphatase [Bacillus sp. FJAT-49736]MBS4175495.1 PP2C family protein-serine/threonine phosphatase [Bacillus sp. FJAT-49736]